MSSPPSPLPVTEPMPQRLSVLYQYHNAPEVAPAHGLECDESVYAYSDKYPVIDIHSVTASKKGSTDSSNRPPVIIFGMKLRTFLVVLLVVIMIIVGAAVGGAVGGKTIWNSGNEMSASTNAKYVILSKETDEARKRTARTNAI